jgi:hypothetical protein
MYVCAVDPCGDPRQPGLFIGGDPGEIRAERDVGDAAASSLPSSSFDLDASALCSSLPHKLGARLFFPPPNRFARVAQPLRNRLVPPHQPLSTLSYRPSLFETLLLAWIPRPTALKPLSRTSSLLPTRPYLRNSRSVQSKITARSSTTLVSYHSFCTARMKG